MSHPQSSSSSSISSTTMKQPPGGDCHDLFGAEFKGSPCHHRVLKPPGGGTSDIFGGPDTVDQSPRRIRTTNHLQSSVFANDTSEPPSTPRNKAGNDSYSRLFGPVEIQPPSASINRMKSNIPFGENDVDDKMSPPDTTTENGQQEPMLSTPQDGNPVTGEGYASTNGDKDGSNPPAAAVTASNEIRRNRVPPGGFSSGLW